MSAKCFLYNVQECVCGGRGGGGVKAGDMTHDSKLQNAFTAAHKGKDTRKERGFIHLGWIVLN